MGRLEPREQAPGQVAHALHPHALHALHAQRAALRLTSKLAEVAALHPSMTSVIAMMMVLKLSLLSHHDVQRPCCTYSEGMASVNVKASVCTLQQFCKVT